MQGEKQIRTLKSCELRAEETEGKKIIYGFIPYNQKSRKMWLGYSDDKFEMLERTVFNKTLGDKANVYANFSHDDSKILGSTKAGTLILNSTDEGLECRCEVPNTSWGHDAWEIITRGDVTTMSFEFVPYEWEEGVNGDTTVLRSAKLDSVSFAVSHPAYTGTDSFTALRSLCKDVDFEKVNKTDKEEIKKLIRSLSELIDAETEKESNSFEQVEAIQTETESRSENAEKENADVEIEKVEADANNKATQEREKLALELELSLSL